MTNTSLSVFLAVVEEMSFTKAAQKLYITQQSLSGHIKRLEDAYGVLLFERKPRLNLTPEGEAMAFYARQIVRAERNLTDRFADLSRKTDGYLDLGLSHQRSDAFFEGIWQRFHPHYPNIDIRLREENTQGLLGALLRGEIDLMIGINVSPSPRLLIEPLTTEQMRIVVSRRLLKEYYQDQTDAFIRQAMKHGITIEDIARLPLIVLPQGNRLRLSLDDMFRRAGIMPHLVLESNHQPMAYRLALKGEAAAALSPIVLYRYYREKRRLPKDVFGFRVKSATENRVQLVSRSDAVDHSYLEAARQAIRDEYAVYNATMEETRL